MESFIIVAAIALTAGAMLAWFICKLAIAKTHVPVTELKNAELRLSALEKDYAVLYEKHQTTTHNYTTLDSEFHTLTISHQNLLADNAKNQERASSLSAEKDNLLLQLSQKELLLEKKLAELTDLTGKLSIQDERLKHQAQQQELYKGELEEMNSKLKKDFELLAQEMLDAKAKKFTDLNALNMKSILDPLKEQIAGFKTKVEDTYDKESKERFSLGREVKNLIEMTQMISTEASNLTRALKGEVKKQGDWGEMILESVLEKSGLVKGREYFLQETIKDEDGNLIKNEMGQAMRPDVTIYYPDKGCLIIDSKVSLTAYDRFVNADDPVQQEAELKSHIQSLRLHIDGLSAKKYHSYVQTLDWVALFVPIEPAYLCALRNDTDLWHYAYSRKIILVCPSNLLAVLKITADLWKREYQSRNAIEIAERGGKLYDKFVNFIETMSDLGHTITKAQRTYDKAFTQLTTGPGNLVRQAEMMKQLGVKAEKQLPKTLADWESLEKPMLEG